MQKSQKLKLQKIVLSKLEAVGLRAAAHLRISEISGGMARRVALARAYSTRTRAAFIR